MSIDKRRIRKLEEAFARRMPPGHNGQSIIEHVEAMLASPEAIAWELEFDRQHFLDDAPGGQLDSGIEPTRRIDFSGMNEDERGEAIHKAYEAWKVDHPHPLADKGF